ncbi:cilia- and flagella-associated protein 251-like [Echeneis naucrates]|uniref:cilia- and flagella-associated protein 251-like n=1 Tax=Echeneis naucrates TaxID=173247 RepID=UPI001113F718|nr:cilia- and flagella-associated protein 251-like [Echeneis naucrates]
MPGQRVAAWLLAFPLGRRGEECASRGRLEMISFWLLCWKLLRATAGLRRATPELTDNHNNCSSGNCNQMDDSPTLTQSVTMAFSSSPLLLTDLERDNIFSSHSHAVEEQHFPEVHGLEEEAAEEENGKTDRDECDHLDSEIGKDKLCKSKEQEEKERREENKYGGGTGETEGQGEGGIIKIEKEGGRETDGQVEEKGIKKEAKTRGKVDLEVRGKAKTYNKDCCRREKEGKDEGRIKIEVEDEGREMIEGDDKVREKIEVADEGREKIEGEEKRREKMEGGDEGKAKKEAEFGDGGDAEREIKADALSVLSFISDNLQCPTPSEPLIFTSHPSQQPVAAKMEDPWGRDLSNRDELGDGHFNDCLQAELAIVYSDRNAGKDKRVA